MKKWVTVLVKCLVAAAAIAMALRQVNPTELTHIRWGLSVMWLLPAVLFFNASQFLSAYRLLQYYRLLQKDMLYRYNLGLYYTGMFYNLFLPGGVGGDVYKVIRLKKRGVNWVPAGKATLLDRVTGLLVILALLALLLNVVSFALPVGFVRLLSLAIVPGFLLYGFMVKRYFPPFGVVINKAIIFSAGIQGLQLLAFFCLLLMLQLPPITYLAYAWLFFAGSLAASVPISIGGIGIRELAMTTGAVYLHVSATMAILASLLFYLITALSALVGWWSQQHRRL